MYNQVIMKINIRSLGRGGQLCTYTQTGTVTHTHTHTYTHTHTLIDIYTCTDISTQTSIHTKHTEFNSFNILHQRLRLNRFFQSHPNYCLDLLPIILQHMRTCCMRASSESL